MNSSPGSAISRFPTLMLFIDYVAGTRAYSLQDATAEEEGEFDEEEGEMGAEEGA